MPLNKALDTVPPNWTTLLPTLAIASKTERVVASGTSFKKSKKGVN